MHVEVHGVVVFREIEFVLAEDFFFEWYRIEYKLKIGVTIKSPNIPNKQSPCNFSTKHIKRQIKFLKRRINGIDNKLFDSLDGSIINFIPRKINIKNS